MPLDCPVHQRSNDSSATVGCNGRLQSEQCADNSRRSQRSRQRCTGQCTVPVRCGTRLSGAPICQSSNSRNRQNPNGWVTWLAHRTVSGGAPDCPVRPSTASPPNDNFGGWGYKYPQPPHFKASKFSANTLNTRASAFNTRHN